VTPVAAAGSAGARLARVAVCRPTAHIAVMKGMAGSLI
jgi:hypothetical protein